MCAPCFRFPGCSSACTLLWSKHSAQGSWPTFHQEGWEQFETSQDQAARQLVQQAEAAHQLAAQQRVAAQPQAAAPPQQAVAQSYLSQSQAAPLPLPPGPWPAVHQAVHAHPQAAPLAALSHHEPQVAAQAVQQVEPGQQLAPPQPSGAVPAPASTLHPSHDTKDFPPEDWRVRDDREKKQSLTVRNYFGFPPPPLLRLLPTRSR